MRTRVRHTFAFPHNLVVYHTHIYVRSHLKDTQPATEPLLIVQNIPAQGRHVFSDGPKRRWRILCSVWLDPTRVRRDV